MKDTQLITAIKSKDIARVKRLIDNGADVNLRDSGMDTPLIAAVKISSIDIVEQLLTGGANLDLQDSKGRTPLIVLADCRDRDYADKDRDDADDMSIAQYLVRSGANFYKRDDAGRTPLIAAANNWDEELIWLLTKYGANVNDVDDNGNTPLSIAVTNKNYDITDSLLDGYGANPDIRAPLKIAVKNNDIKIVKLLLASDADASIRIDGMSLMAYAQLQGFTALHCVLYRHSIGGADSA